MYNLLVTNDTNSWKGDPWIIERSRCIRVSEYTDEDIVKRFGALSAPQVHELLRLPSVFAYESGRGTDPRFGFIRDIIVQQQQARVKVTYDLVECTGFVTADELESLGPQLGISRRWEMGRTHWAVKDVDLARVLRDERRISLPQKDDVVPRLHSRADERTSDDLWHPADAPRVFISHLASRRQEVHDLAESLKHFGFTCFVAHDAIEPSREWRREIERALNSCDLLLAYVTPGFSENRWTDQETGWALGRGLAAIPISVEGETPYGFIGSYQAVKRTAGISTLDLSMLVLKAICDVAFDRHRPAVPALAEKVALGVADALALARDGEAASFFYELLQKVPERLWAGDLESRSRAALHKNEALLSRTRSRNRSATIAQLLRQRVDSKSDS